jgi:[NiFe] hydrogenase diaphorase moiety large subunit
MESSMLKKEMTIIKQICADCNNDRNRLMDIAIEVQNSLGCVSSESMDLIAAEIGGKRVEVDALVSFYAFLTDKPKGKIVIRLCNDVIDKMAGYERIVRTFQEELGINIGETTPDGTISLEETACIGMCDQAPAALINDVVVTKLTSDRIRYIIESLLENPDPNRLITETGDGNNSSKWVEAEVRNNIRLRGPVVFADFNMGDALINALAMSPREVIREIKTARLRGRGGAGFPTGMKWEFTRAAAGKKKYILCNADEGEPGTFKDRVLLTQKPHLFIEGMTIAAYAIGAQEGIIYLRGEYNYLKRFLETILAERRRKNLLGDEVYGKKNFNFDIRIQSGAGAYICGEETAMISSCEGRRGSPKNRPPFPAQKGYLESPTVVNNVETFCCIAKISEKGAGWFAQRGTNASTGTKLLSVSGDCELPGVYEVPFGMKMSELLRLVSAFDTQAVQVGGPSGQMIGREHFERTICYDDLATGGSIMIFDKRRNLLSIVHSFMDFFVDESCGYCTPCRVGNVLMKQRLEGIMKGLGKPGDIEYLEALGETIKKSSRCGLGQTSPNPILSTIKNFRKEYELRFEESDDTFVSSFDILNELKQATSITGRKSTIFQG